MKESAPGLGKAAPGLAVKNGGKEQDDRGDEKEWSDHVMNADQDEPTAEPLFFRQRRGRRRQGHREFAFEKKYHAQDEDHEGNADRQQRNPPVELVHPLREVERAAGLLVEEGVAKLIPE